MSGHTLFVGEGNFSFSSALSKLSPENKITATCLQRQEDVKHEGAAANIQMIRDSGGTILFGVDCTRLEECASLQGAVFNRVIFNFPHCGRKSGVKKNRELLKKFFLSCVKVLDEHGDIHVALCNGQGGTPADQPMREWQNSWQVVAMAAEADLVLSSVQPFKSEEVESYKCTGYRSQDKGFHVENALVHVFTRSHPYTTPVRMYDDCDDLIMFFLTSRDFLCIDSVHPIKLVQDYVVNGLEERCCITMATKPPPFLLNSEQRQTASLDGDDVTEMLVFFFVLRPSLLPQMEEMTARRGEAKERGDLQTGKVVSVEEQIDGSHCRENTGASIGRMFGISGLVFRDVPISPWAPPVFHQLLLRGLFPAACQPITSLGQTLERLLSPHGVSVVKEAGCLYLTAQPMGAVGRVFASVGKNAEGWVQVTVSLNLDLIASCLFSLPDWRLLWTRDPCFSKCFDPCLPLHPPLGEPQPSMPLFRQPSLFSRRLSFDVSFWKGPSAWDDRKFHALAREACLGAVEKVELVDFFSRQEQQALRTSYCYRVTYHSHSHALSHTKALELHRRLESLLCSHLHVTIR
uniref:Ferredoxin-fold anticodon binding domain containing 1 n=1 Tax=Gadus morhua TaxID=8049 RepID=A0A8C5FQJ8_GADMO